MEESNLAMFNHEIGKEKTDVINVYLQIRIYLILFISFVCKKVDNNGDNLHNSGTLKTIICLYIHFSKNHINNLNFIWNNNRSFTIVV